MTKQAALKLLNDAQYEAEINKRYHQILAWRWGFADRSIRAAVGVMAVVGLWVSLKGPEWQTWSEVLGVFSVALATALNVFPTGDYEKQFIALFTRWCAVAKSASICLSRLDETESTEVDDSTAERLRDIVEAKHVLEAEETAPWRTLLTRCQEDTNESIYGPNIRTFQQVADHLADHDATPPEPS